MRRSQTYKEHREKLRAWRREMHKVFREAGALRTLDDMSDEEITALERAYGCKVHRSNREEGEE